jgi:hypothetical protein
MKKLFAMLLALSLLLSLSAGFTASAEEILSGVEALFTGEEKAFDPDLVGAWVLDKSEQTNDVSSELLENLFKDLFFLPDGSFSSAVLPFPYVAAMGQRAPKASTADGTIVLYDALNNALGDAVYSLVSILPESFKDYVTELGNISELHIDYTFFDIPAEGNDDVHPRNDIESTLFKQSDKDGVKIHVKAIIAEDGLSRKAFEGTGSFHKTVNEDLMLAYLTGYWTDSSNNSWTFGYGEKDGDPYYQYSAMLANGEYHESEPGESPWAHTAGDSIYGSFEPYFEGASAVYKITNITADTMTMRDAVGEITMTRAW